VDGWLEHGGCAFVVGPSGRRETFFGLHMAVSVATGADFLGFSVPTTRRISYFQLEVKPSHFQKRLAAMCKAMNVDKKSLGNLVVFNMRGATENALSETSIKSMVRRAKAEVVIIDPAYLLLGDENEQKEAKAFVKRLARIASGTGAALICVFHTSKNGVTGREAIDASAGSGVFGRSCDAQFVLAPHEEGSDYVVLQTVTRNYKSPDDCTLRFADGCFVRDALPPVVKTPGQRKQAEAITAQAVKSWFAEKNALNQTELNEQLTKAGVPKSGTGNQIRKLLETGLLVEEPKRGSRNARIYRLPTNAGNNRHHEEFEDSDLSGIKL
jgi:hypothetical protein